MIIHFQDLNNYHLIITYLTYSNETFGSFKVRKSTELPSKTNQLKSGEISSIVICGFIFFTVFRKMKNKKQEENAP